MKRWKIAGCLVSFLSFVTNFGCEKPINVSCEDRDSTISLHVIHDIGELQDGDDARNPAQEREFWLDNKELEWVSVCDQLSWTHFGVNLAANRDEADEKGSIEVHRLRGSGANVPIWYDRDKSKLLVYTRVVLEKESLDDSERGAEDESAVELRHVTLRVRDASIRADPAHGGPGPRVLLCDESKPLLGQFSRRNRNQPIAVVHDGCIISILRFAGEVSDGFHIFGVFQDSVTRDIVRSLR